MLKRHLMTETLEQLLRNELLPAQEEEGEKDKKRVKVKLPKSGKKKDGEKGNE